MRGLYDSEGDNNWGESAVTAFTRTYWGRRASGALSSKLLTDRSDKETKLSWSQTLNVARCYTYVNLSFGVKW